MAVAALLAFAGDAAACSCVAAPIQERLDQADAAVIGRVVSEETWELEGGPAVTRLTIAVEQHVKGDLGETIYVETPSGTSCDVGIVMDTTTGLLLTRRPHGTWFASACSVVTPNELVSAGGEPRGGVIKVVLGVLFLGIVLTWALRRKARGTRPSIPGAPEP